MTDLRPLPEGNSAGLLPFYLILAATVTGFVTMLQLRAHASRLSLRAWLGCVLALAVLVGGTLAVLTGPVIGAQHGPLPELWAAIAGMTAVAALWASTMEVLAGAWNFIPTFGLLMVIGIQSSGGAVAPPLLPRSTASSRSSSRQALLSTRSVTLYFTDAQNAEPVIVPAAWIAGLLAALLLATRLRGRTPGGQPGRPAGQAGGRGPGQGGRQAAH